MKFCRLGRWIAVVSMALGCACLLVGGAVSAKEKAKPKPKPAAKAPAKPKAEAPKEAAPEANNWALRDHFTFTFGKYAVYYAVQESAWWLMVEGQDAVIQEAGFRITFADGSTLDASGLGKAENQRIKFSNAAGDGTAYTNGFPPKDGLVVRHSMSVPKERPFLMFRVGLGNAGDKPIEIAKISPVVFGVNAIAHWSPDTSIGSRRVVYRGGSPVFDKNAPPALNVVRDQAHDLTLSFGILSDGVAASSAELLGSAGTWTGSAECVYDPPIRLEPGQKLESDPAWFSMTIPAASRIDHYYSWVVSTMPRPPVSKDIPRCWVTVDKGGSLTDLLDTVKDWGAAGVRCALVPGTWEGRPGSLEGSTPAYPKDMAKAADQIANAGMAPGLTVDPLMTQDGGKDWTAVSSGGTTWLNPVSPEARKHGADRMKKLVEAGFKFFVIQPSAIPDEVLKHFNVTRAQADRFAFEVMADAAGGLPVLASSAYAMKAELDPWLEAAAGVSRVAGFGVTPGPVRFDMTGVSSVDDTLLAAMTLFNGPIEFMGKPNSDAVRQVARLLARQRIFGCPLDLAKSTPKLWQLPMRGAEDGYRGDAVLMFPGAGSWSLADLNRDKEGDVLIWRAADGSVFDPASALETQQLTVCGVTPKLNHPVLMGASGSMTLLLDDLKSLKWDEGAGVLSGAFAGDNRERATAFVYVPEGFALKSGKAGGASVGKKSAGPRLEFPVEAGKETRFELEFTRK